MAETADLVGVVTLACLFKNTVVYFEFIRLGHKTLLVAMGKCHSEWMNMIEKWYGFRDVLGRRQASLYPYLLAYVSQKAVEICPPLSVSGN